MTIATLGYGRGVTVAALGYGRGMTIATLGHGRGMTITTLGNGRVMAVVPPHRSGSTLDPTDESQDGEAENEQLEHRRRNGVWNEGDEKNSSRRSWLYLRCRGCRRIQSETATGFPRVRSCILIMRWIIEFFAGLDRLFYQRPVIPRPSLGG